MKKKWPTRTGMDDTRPIFFCKRFSYNENALYPHKVPTKVPIKKLPKVSNRRGALLDEICIYYMHVVITTDTPGQAMVLCSRSSKSNGPRHSLAGPGAAAPEHALSELVSARQKQNFCLVFEMLRSYMAASALHAQLRRVRCGHQDSASSIGYIGPCKRFPTCCTGLEYVSCVSIFVSHI